MNLLLVLYEKLQAEKQSLEITIGHNKVADWSIEIIHWDSNTIIFNEFDCNIELLSSKAYIALYEWFLDKFEYMP